MIDPRAGRVILEAVDTRFDQLRRQQPYTAYGTVATVDVPNKRCSVYVSGDAAPSAGFVYPLWRQPAVGERVRVVIDPRGDRYVEETLQGVLTLGPQDGVNEGAEMLLKGAGSWPDWAIDLWSNQYRVHSGGLVNLEVRSDNGTVWNRYGAMVRYVPLTVGSSHWFDYTLTGSGSGNEEFTALPANSDVVLAHGRIEGRVDSVASGPYVGVHSYVAGAVTGLWGGVLYPQVNSKYDSVPFVAAVGGTNGRQLRLEYNAGGSTLRNVSIYIIGYWTKR